MIDRQITKWNFFSTINSIGTNDYVSILSKYTIDLYIYIIIKFDVIDNDL